jgi:3-hydroxyacyl-[acyl-carrier-protein] dehydratase
MVLETPTACTPSAAPVCDTVAPTLPDGFTLPFDSNTIQTLIPHRYPFLLIDRVTALDPGKTIEAYKNVSHNEPFFPGHFPQKALMPGVLIIEALAQAACLMARILPEYRHALGVLVGADNFRFRRMVEPGDQLILKAEMITLRKTVGKVHGVALVNGQVAAEGDILFSMVET